MNQQQHPSKLPKISTNHVLDEPLIDTTYPWNDTLEKEKNQPFTQFNNNTCTTSSSSSEDAWWKKPDPFSPLYKPMDDDIFVRIYNNATSQYEYVSLKNDYGQLSLEQAQHACTNCIKIMNSLRFRGIRSPFDDTF